MTRDQFCEHLRGLCREAGGQAAWARAHELTPAYVSDVINQRRMPGDKICRAAGVKREYIFIETREGA